MSAPAGRTAAEVCNLNRITRRRIGLTSGRILDLYDEARDCALAEGCTCGVQRIAPIPKGDGTFHVNVYHAPGCKAHPLEHRRRGVKRWRRLRYLRWRAERWRRLRREG